MAPFCKENQLVQKKIERKVHDLENQNANKGLK
jgi:hypothetical protein